MLLDPDRVDELTAGQVLTTTREMKRLEDAAAAGRLLLACAWADRHPALEPGEEATFVTRDPDGGGLHTPISGRGCPQVTEYAVAEFGAVLGESTAAAKTLIGQALEIRHRLPRLWALVQAGRTPAWRARLVTAETIAADLTPEAADFVDRQVAAGAGRSAPRPCSGCSPRRWPGSTSRPVTTTQGRTGGVWTSTTGLDPAVMHLHAVMSTADALDLGNALSQRAAELKALGSEDDLAVRKSRALGELPRQQTALTLWCQDNREAGAPDDVVLPSAREVVLTLHFDAALAGDALTVGPLGRLLNGQSRALLDHVKAWTSDSHTRVSVRPVIDLNEELTAPGYEIPDRIRDHVTERDGSCRFPWCSQPAARCDLDHVIEFDHDADEQGRPQPGPTSTTNLIPLCRRHHRLKTFTAWRVVMPTPGVVIWTSPHGHQFRRDRTGSTALGQRD